MDVYIYIINGFAILFLVLLWGLSQFLLFSDDEDSKWVVLINGLSLLLSYSIYQSCLHVTSLKNSLIVWGICVFLTLLSLLIGGVRKQVPLGVMLIGFFLYIILGALPFYMVLSSTNTLVLPISTPNNAVGIKIVDILPYLASILALVVSFYFVVSNKNVINYSLKSYEYQLRDLKKALSMYGDFEEPYSRFVRQDLRNMMDELTDELRDELKRNVNIPKSTGKLNQNKQEQILKEIRTLTQKIGVMPQNTMPFSFSDLTSNIKHTLTTPLSQIQINCEVLRPKLYGEELERIARIDDCSKICLAIINAYVEANTVSSLPAFMGLNTALKEYGNMVRIQNNREQINIDISELPDVIEGYSSNYIYALIVPLLQNAVVASPDNSQVTISYKKIADAHQIFICNECKGKLPTIEQLNTIGYSSKLNHKGIGIQSVRNLISMVKGCGLEFNIVEDKVIGCITLKERK